MVCTYKRVWRGGGLERHATLLLEPDNRWRGPCNRALTTSKSEICQPHLHLALCSELRARIHRSSFITNFHTEKYHKNCCFFPDQGLDINEHRYIRKAIQSRAKQNRTEQDRAVQHRRCATLCYAVSHLSFLCRHLKQAVSSHQLLGTSAVQPI